MGEYTLIIRSKTTRVRGGTRTRRVFVWFRRFADDTIVWFQWLWIEEIRDLFSEDWRVTGWFIDKPKEQEAHALRELRTPSQRMIADARKVFDDNAL